MSLEIRAYHRDDEADVIELWRTCELTRGWNDPARDIARKLTVQPELFVVALDDRTIVGSLMAGFDGHRGWLNYLAVVDTHRRRGIARALVREAEQRLHALGCPKINLQVRPENDAAVGFYARLGYIKEPRLNFGKRLIDD
ncbi:MAG TPA: GNAT family acetyltransferase [Polyangiales bacterium]|nr:GNAT family acetyltransferase [Polyangiales bacterium]